MTYDLAEWRERFERQFAENQEKLDWLFAEFKAERGPNVVTTGRVQELLRSLETGVVVHGVPLTVSELAAMDRARAAGHRVVIRP